jgi:lipase
MRFRRLAEERLAGRFRVRALDLRGHGRSGWEEPWTIDQHVQDVLETVSGPGAWIGHSFGGRLVAEITARRPELVERAVLLDPAIWVPPPIALERAEATRPDRSFATPDEAVDARFAAGGLFHTPRELVEEEARIHLAPDVVPEVLAETYREGVGEQVEVVTVPGGHVLLWDAFDETADAVAHFLAS